MKLENPCTLVILNVIEQQLELYFGDRKLHKLNVTEGFEWQW
jgi:hypothetical protein